MEKWIAVAGFMAMTGYCIFLMLRMRAEKKLHIRQTGRLMKYHDELLDEIISCRDAERKMSANEVLSLMKRCEMLEAMLRKYGISVANEIPMVSISRNRRRTE